MIDRNPMCISLFLFLFFFVLFCCCCFFLSFIFSSGGHHVQQSGLNNFGRGSPKKHSCEIIEKSVQQCQKRSLLKQNCNVCMLTFMENQPLLWLLKA